jgi:phosphoribosylformylglycinamidine synthase
MRIGMGGGAVVDGDRHQHRRPGLRLGAARQPEMERRAQEVINAAGSWAKNPIISIHDVGAGGLSNAFPEITNDAKRGAIFDLRKMPLEESGMAPKEIWSNESQERYVLAIAPDAWSCSRRSASASAARSPWSAWPPKSAS